jgi:nitronate monooxygenase
MRNSTDLRSLLGIAHPIIQAPMAGGTTTPELVAAVSNAGALGSLGAAYLTPAQILETIAEVRRRTDRPFNVNLFVGGIESAEGRDPAPLLEVLARYHAELGLPAPVPPAPAGDPFEAQLEAVLQARPPVFSFTFGIPPAPALAALKAAKIPVVGTATTVEEARLLEAAGVDAVVAQGAEAGGHRGTFAGPFAAGLVGTMALVPQVVDAVAVPVIAAGGIMDGRGIVAARALGAAGVQMGTAFLTCREAGVPDAYKAAVRAARDDQTEVTRAFSGRPARGVVNEFLRALRGREDAILPFPLQNTATRPLRSAAAKRGDTRYLSLWAGQAAGLARDLPAGDLVRMLVREAEEVARRGAGFSE